MSINYFSAKETSENNPVSTRRNFLRAALAAAAIVTTPGCAGLLKNVPKNVSKIDKKTKLKLLNDVKFPGETDAPPIDDESHQPDDSWVNFEIGPLEETVERLKKRNRTEMVRAGIKLSEMDEVETVFSEEIIDDNRSIVCVRTRKKINAEKEVQAVKPSNNKKLENESESEKLHVNVGKSHYQRKKSRTAGEKDLHELCEKAKLEEGWLFVKQNSAEGRWIECGINETSRRATVDISPIKKMKGKSSEISEISLYHHHPISRLRTDTSQTPSRIDIEGFVNAMRIVKREALNLLGKIDFRVVTSSGIYIFKIDPIILDNPTLAEKIYEVGEKIARERMSLIFSSDFNYSISNKTNFHKENAKFAKKFSIPPLMRIQFQPKKG